MGDKITLDDVTKETGLEDMIEKMKTLPPELQKLHQVRIHAWRAIGFLDPRYIRSWDQFVYELEGILREAKSHREIYEPRKKKRWLWWGFIPIPRFSLGR